MTKRDWINGPFVLEDFIPTDRTADSITVEHALAMANGVYRSFGPKRHYKFVSGGGVDWGWHECDDIPRCMHTAQSVVLGEEEIP